MKPNWYKIDLPNFRFLTQSSWSCRPASLIPPQRGCDQGATGLFHLPFQQTLARCLNSPTLQSLPREMPHLFHRGQISQSRILQFVYYLCNLRLPRSSGRWYWGNLRTSIPQSPPASPERSRWRAGLNPSIPQSLNLYPVKCPIYFSGA